MKSKQKKQAALKVCALGFDSRTYSALKFFFKNKCGNRAVLVEAPDAQVGIIDMDAFSSEGVLNDFRERYPDRELILMSLDGKDGGLSDAIRVTKPAQPDAMLEALEQIRGRLKSRTAAETVVAPDPASLPVSETANAAAAAKMAPVADAIADDRSEPALDVQPLPEVSLSDTALGLDAPLKKAGESASANSSGASTGKPKGESQPLPPPGRRIFAARTIPKSITSAAMLLDEKGFGEYIGSLKDIDPDDPSEVRIAQYDPKAFFQGYLQAACRRARETNCVMRLYTGWKPITIFPQTREILIDAEESQLRAFCLVPVHSIADLDYCDPTGGIMTIKPAAHAGPPESGEDQSKLQSIESFLWKVALWTSAGRIPKDVDLNGQIHLRHWPNLTRLLIFPHAMRVAALLSDEPRSVMDVVRTLEIRQQYAFAFVSASRALGLIERPSRSAARRAAAHAEPAVGSSILKKILRRLTGR